ncbi:hypothetical protein NJC38_28590 [Pseudomonas sp. 21LCFQ010]|uniref:hypothetical protein n=1 Tax=Pseudomonas sp. 21LCFQ010 TaxID=2957506 RepID=UPI0020971A99|nr:hypothetical protein [Pseudomonas sp. 21LCFQ010]MCO8166091.1 hypothetical protein [Pseudomonas sp. 21LCFQ010]
MQSKLDPTTRDAIAFIEGLCERQLITWPIDFEFLATTDEDLAETFGHWFGGQRWAAQGDSFVQFGQDGTGSLFLLWYYPGLTGTPPVVFMGSEGESSLVAGSLEDFIRQLGSGQVFYVDSWVEPDEDDNQDMDWQALAEAIDERYGLSDETAQQLAEQAARLHPDFTGWVESKVEYV